ncbi:hypothetical protein CDA63_08970 [Hymenobacter amundsenii]|uniref:Uncharacterized protein n=1 Tax=Hymenobacter amundsenii TaxID=2006685 RepID=A0A246FL66_9BACT|nr:hypothetical protein [Hymenobacter amundsenii]OWP63497.1 hypothetical protein CDA63_08970 [Hymenobacter amundsenii]
MADLHNPLFEDEKEFLERQKLEYERALRGDVAEIKAKTLEVGKYAAIGAGVLGGIWLISKALSGKKSAPKNQKALKAADKQADRQLKSNARRPYPSTNVDTAVADDLGFGAGRVRQGRTGTTAARPSETDPFQPAPATTASDAKASRYPVAQYQATETDESDNGNSSSEASSIMASTFKAFMQSDTGKLLVAQASAVVLAFVAKKAGEYLPILKNADLAGSGGIQKEPETRDIEFTYHDDDADAPKQPA